MATTIASYNVAFGLKTAGLVDASKLSRKELSSLQSTLRSLETPADKYEKQVRSLATAVEKGAITQEHYNRALKQSQDVFSKTAQHADHAQKSFVGVGTAVVGLAAGAGFGSLIKDSIRLAAEAETAGMMFANFLEGDAGRAKDMLAEIRDFAAKSPLSLTDAREGARNLLAQGVAAHKVLPTLRALGDISLGNADVFRRLAYVYGEVNTATRLTGENNRQFVNAGWNPLRQIAVDLAKQFGGLADDYMPNLKKAMEDGLISFNMLEGAIFSATKEGERYGGMTEKIGELTQGSIAQALDSWEQLKTALGERIAPHIVELTKQAPGAKSKAEEYLDTADTAIWGIRATTAALEDLWRPVLGLKTIGQAAFTDSGDKLTEGINQILSGFTFESLGKAMDKNTDAQLVAKGMARDELYKEFATAKTDSQILADKQQEQIRIAEEQKKLQQQQVELMKNLRPNQPIERIR